MALELRRRRRRRVAAPLLLAVLAAVASMAAVPASTSRAGATVSSRVVVGDLAGLPSGTVRIAPVNPDVPLHVEVTLRPRSAADLERAVASVTTPGSPGYHHYLAKNEFGVRFGASPSDVSRVEKAFRAGGLSSFTLSPDRLSLTVTGAARSFEHVLDVVLARYRTSSGTSFVAPEGRPTLPASAGSLVASVIGLDTRPSLAPEGLVHLRADDLGATASHAVRGAVAPSASCATTIDEVGAGFTPDEIASAYGLDGLYAAGDSGSGVSIGVIEFSSYDASDLAAYDSCFSIAPSVQVVPVDGGPTQAVASNEVEAELDIEDLEGLAPGANLIVYEGGDGGGDVSNQSAYDTYAAAIDADAAKVITTSWGSCEASIDTKTLEAENTLFEQAALQGQTVVAAAGDSGSEDCDGTLSGSAGRALAVDDPASQPFVTGVGGTTLTLTPTRSEVVWNTGSEGAESGAGGGGLSSVWPEPLYQKDAAASLGVASAAEGGTCTLSGGCREVPDVALNAGSPYAIYCSLAGFLCGRAGWTSLGGTSAAAPTFGAIIALADASSACATGLSGVESSLGFVNPELYEIGSGTGYADAFTDVTSGDNDLLGTNGGKFQAGTGYDLASGLGSPIAGDGADGALVAQLCSATTVRAASPTSGLPAPTITKLAPDDGRATGQIRVVLHGTGFSGTEAVSFGATPATSFRVVSATEIVAVAPAGSGKVHVSVSTATNASAAGRGNIFDWLPVPDIHRLAAASGPSSGGATVVVIGDGFTRASTVRFGGTPARSVTERSPERLVVVTPPGSGTVRVTVANGTVRSIASSRDRYTYH